MKTSAYMPGCRAIPSGIRRRAGDTELDDVLVSTRGSEAGGILEVVIMTKKIAVLIRDRESEALRMTLGLTLMDDIVNVFLLGRKFDLSEADEANKELMQEMDIAFFSDHEANGGTEFVATDDLAQRLTEYDHVIPY